MHEMSLVVNILDIATDRARRSGARVINSVEIDVGRLAGVEIDALTFCFEVARRDSIAAEASLMVHEICGRGRCSHCGQESEIDFHVAVCGDCGQGPVEVLQGRELCVRSINVD